MTALAVNVAIISENRVLLTRRDDFEVWCLPGGGVEEGETLAMSAVREVKEETGLDIELTSLVGIYSRTGVTAAHTVVFSAVPVGGTLQTQPGETIDIRFFTADEIPANLSLGHRQRISDALNGVGGSAVMMQEMILPADQTVSSRDFAEARKAPIETRREFYQRVIKRAVLHTTDELRKK